VYAGGVGNMNCVAAVIASSDEDAPAFPMCALCQGLSATRRERKPRRASADGWRNAGQRGIQRDPYGVARYIYAARGCEYGVGAD